MGKAAAKNFSLNSANVIFGYLEDLQTNLKRLGDIIKATLALSSLKLRQLQRLRSKLEAILNCQINSRIYLDRNGPYIYARIKLSNNRLLKRYLGKNPEEKLSLIEKYNELLKQIHNIEDYLDKISEQLTEINEEITWMIEEPELIFGTELEEVEANEY